jgi:hypothetical protein
VNFVRIIGKGKKCHNAKLTKQPWLIKVANKHDLNFKMLDHYNMKFVHQIQSFHCHFLCFIFIKKSILIITNLFNRKTMANGSIKKNPKH